MSLLVVGSVAFDALETPYGKIPRTLGGAATYFAVSASFFAPVRLVAVVGDDFTKRHAGIFRGRRIDLAGLERAPGKTFFWAGRYSQDMNQRETLATDLNVFADFNPRLPEQYRDSRYIFLANIQPTLQASVIRQIRGRPKVIALDTMNYWIDRTLPALRKTLRDVQVLLINDTETQQLTAELNLMRAAERIFRMGPNTLVVKRGEYGALLIRRGSIFSVPAFPLKRIYDPTGAGDSFAGGFMGYLAAAGSRGLAINDATLRRAMVYGSVLGSFTVERLGLDRLRNLTRREIDARARQFQRLTQFRL